MEDIKDKNDIVLLVNNFYKKALSDLKIGYIFTDVVKINFELHMPKMYDFWSSILLDEISYKGNPILTHIHLNKKESLSEVHFEVWLSLWESTVNSLFIGPKATEAIQKSKNIAGLMQYKIKQSLNKNNIL